ncbi:DNA polymerase III alpha subunit [Tamilnaduibacter salinus]|uniref:DNA polymerase III subunit alpha n=1 Tax=Tamilnaduibacter salinus TaxID=1484056 RepID=A0A2U1CT46_9GAMM|nr:DNA polymerase III subunit alpha [Tamilnaduibacter salinus]PVY69615.1 DNA polymerase III alpha subunit [Tamilnaduibacter salinus]
MSSRFVHLRVHSEYSLSDGLVRVKPLIKRVAELGMPAVGLTEQSNMCSLVRFYKAAMEEGVKPIIGADIWLSNPEEPENPFRLTLFARNQTGYLNLTEIISLGYTEGQHNGVPIIAPQWIESRRDGLLALSGAKLGDVGRALVAGKTELAQERAEYWQRLFPDAYYLELHRTGRPNDEECLHASVELADTLGLPVVATNDVHFMAPEDFEAHEARVCIGESRTLDDPRRERRFSDQQYLRSPEEMEELFADIPEAIDNTIEIARRCSVKVRMGEYFLPDYPIPEGMTMDEYFRKVSEEGLEDRLTRILDPDQPDYQEQRERYFKRLDFELNIIIQMGFPGYFLIVMDFIQWAKNNGIPVGPGRGSGAGSLVAYSLLITDLDPLGYDLLFERFLNPERVSMPDFDVDFCMENRDRVIEYVAEKYGRNAVSQIITFGTMAAKAVVRDVARVQGKSYGLADKLSKMIPFEPGMTLDKAIEEEEAIGEFLEQDEEAQEIWDMAKKLEGVCRNAGKHAGGVVIAPTKITDFSALYCDEEGGSPVTQFDKGDVEDAGLVKFDFLGLRTLTIIDWALQMINPRLEKRGEPPLDINRIPLDDKPSFEMLRKAETTAVFQLESRGMKDLIRRLRPDTLEDMIALVALFRPGPLQSGMVDDFIDRKHGKQPVAYPHPDFQYEGLKPVLAPTYGIILYQEQVMQIAQVMANFSLGGADLLRRAMGKKKMEEMAKQKVKFLEGCDENGISRELGENIFDLVEKFAGYGFNKSHSAAYALVSYQTLWLKAHYTAEFMAATLTADMQNTDKVVTLIEECRNLELDIVLPDVSRSEYSFTVDDDGRVVYGLGAIKGLGEGPIQSIVENRDEGPYQDLFDFCRRVDLKRVNKRAIEALIRAGALDRLGPGRAQMMASIDKAIQQAEQQSRNESVGMMDMFGEALDGSEGDPFEAVAGMRDWPEKERLKAEKDTLGLYLTGHPFDEYEHEVRRFARQSIADLKAGRSPQRVAGLVVAMRTMKNRRGQTMAFVTLDDRSARIEATLFSETWHEARDLLQSDEVVVVDGVVSFDDYSGTLKMRANAVMDVPTARRQFSRGLRVSLESGQLANGLLDRLDETLAPHRGEGCPVWIDYCGDQARTRIELGENWRVRPDDNLLLNLRHLIGDSAVELVYD